MGCPSACRRSVPRNWGASVAGNDAIWPLTPDTLEPLQPLVVMNVGASACGWMIEDKQTAAAIEKIVSRMRAVVDELAFDERRQVLLSIRAISGEIADRLEAPQPHSLGRFRAWGPRQLTSGLGALSGAVSTKGKHARQIARLNGCDLTVDEESGVATFTRVN
jgi:hypothetical protein